MPTGGAGGSTLAQERARTEELRHAVRTGEPMRGSLVGKVKQQEANQTRERRSEALTGRLKAQLGNFGAAHQSGAEHTGTFVRGGY